MIQQIVNLLHVDRTLKPGQAIEQVAKRMGRGNWKKIWERLRKRWPKLEKNRLLPPPETEEVLQEQIAEGMRAVYDQREASREAAVRELAIKEDAAESSSGLQIKGRDASDILKELQREKERLEGIINQSIDQVVSYYQREDIGRDDAIARHLKYRNTYLKIDQQIALVREIRDLRRQAGVG